MLLVEHNCHLSFLNLKYKIMDDRKLEFVKEFRGVSDTGEFEYIYLTNLDGTFVPGSIRLNEKTGKTIFDKLVKKHVNNDLPLNIEILQTYLFKE